jgi:hypothetical protein
VTDSQGTGSLSAFVKRAAELGAITEYEADGSGRVYAVYENNEILPIGITILSLAGLSHIPLDRLDVAVRAEWLGRGH